MSREPDREADLDVAVTSAAARAQYEARSAGAHPTAKRILDDLHLAMRAEVRGEDLTPVALRVLRVLTTAVRRRNARLLRDLARLVAEGATRRPRDAVRYYVAEMVRHRGPHVTATDALDYVRRRMGHPLGAAPASIRTIRRILAQMVPPSARAPRGRPEKRPT